MGRPRVMLADDHTLVLEAFKIFLESEFEIVGTAAGGFSLLSLAPSLKPDVIVLDIGMPEMNGMEAGVELKRLLPHTKLIALTMNEDPDVAREALRLWASGYLLKKSAGSELVKAIREALRGCTYVTLKVARQLEDGFVRDPKQDRKKELTTRQKEVLQLLAEGRTMRQAACQLRVTPRTIAFHKYRIMGDFGLRTYTDLVKFALQKRVIAPF